MALVFVVVMVALSVPIVVTVTDRVSVFCAEITPPDYGGEGAQCELKFHCLLYVLLLYKVTNRLPFLCAGFVQSIVFGYVEDTCLLYFFREFGAKV